MHWHNAFVFNSQDLTFDVYEVYLTDGSALRTMCSRYTLRGVDVDDLILELEQMIKDLKRGHVFNSLGELDEKYGIKE